MRKWTKYNCGRVDCQRHLVTENYEHNLFFYKYTWWLGVENKVKRKLQAAHVDEVEGAIEEANEILDKLEK